MRTLVVRKNSDLQSLSSELLASGLAAGRSRAALDSLQALNPHVDFTKLAPGTVLFVPDAPDFKPGASKSIAAEALDDFEKLVRSGVEAASAGIRSGQEKRTAERAKLGAAFKSAAVKRVAESDPQVRKQLDDAAKRLKQDEQGDARSDKTLQAALKSVNAELAALRKLLG